MTASGTGPPPSTHRIGRSTASRRHDDHDGPHARNRGNRRVVHENSGRHRIRLPKIPISAINAQNNGRKNHSRRSAHSLSLSHSRRTFASRIFRHQHTPQSRQHCVEIPVIPQCRRCVYFRVSDPYEDTNALSRNESAGPAAPGSGYAPARPPRKTWSRRAPSQLCCGSPGAR
jgi:hypothetical protein